MDPRPQADPDLADLLSRKGVRPTTRRLEVLGELAREHNDLTAQALWQRLRARSSPTGLATVYRTLALLSEKGVVDSLSHHGGELCYRLCSDVHHHHLVCTSCHRVVEVPECDLGGRLDELAGRYGFVATGHELEITGLCGACRS